MMHFPKETEHDGAMRDRLRELWARDLNLQPDEVEDDDNFFELGGDSIAAMRLVANARKQGIILSVADMFRFPTFEEMLHVSATAQKAMAENKETQKPFALIEDASIIGKVAAECGVLETAIQDIYPCTPLQEGVMALSNQQSNAYLAHHVFRIHPDADVQRLQDAWASVFEHTEILRTRIVHLERYGSVQTVIREKIRWEKPYSLETYLEHKKGISDLFGRPLSEYAIVDSGSYSQKHLIWSTHHAIYDGWSLPLILRQVEEVYAGSTPNSTSSPPFSMFIQYLKDLDLQRCDVFWRDYLRGTTTSAFPPQVADNANFQRRVQDTAYLDTSIGRTPGSALTTSTLIRAAWALIMSQYSDCDDVVFGVTLTGRNAPVPRIDEMIGPTIATLPLRIHVQRDGSETLHQYLQKVQAQAAEMIPFEHAGLQRIRRLSPEIQRCCDFQNLLVIQPIVSTDGGEHLMKQESGSSQQTDFHTYPLVVECELKEGAVSFHATFDNNRVTKSQIVRMLYQFEHVFQQLLSVSEDSRILDIEWISRQDRADLSKWNSYLPPKINKCIHWLIEQQAVRRPDESAISSWDGELSYGQLNVLSTKLASHLLDLGVKPGVKVPICFEKTKWAIVAMLAILKARCAYVPLNPSHPPGRSSLIIRDVQAELILTSPAQLPYCQDMCAKRVVVCDSLMSSLDNEVDCVNDSRSSIKSSISHPNDVAYVLYTSGSTGLPKGVLVEHAALCTSVWAQGQSMGYSCHSRVLQYSAYTFDVSVGDIFGCLLHGGCVCIISEDQRLNLHDLTSTIQAVKANHACLTPSVARMLQPSHLPHLETLSLGGEPVTQQDLSLWGEKDLVNGYGVTEATVFCTYSRPLRNSDNISTNIGSSPVSLFWVTSPQNDQQLAPVGSEGELLIEGPTLAREYLNDTDKTRSSFITNPSWVDSFELSGHLSDVSRRFYKTGDLVKYAADGTLEFIGRKDTQVKVRGQRVELGEVEYWLKSHLSPSTVVAVDVVSPAKGTEPPILVAFLYCESKRESNGLTEGPQEELPDLGILIPTLYSELILELPEHMIPTAFIPLDSMPYSSSGKIDRGELKQIGSYLSREQMQAYSKIQGPKKRPSTSLQLWFQSVWADVLMVDPDSIGIDDSFFRLGGDSILAVQVATRCRSGHVAITVQDILRHKTIERLVEKAQSVEAFEEQIPGNGSQATISALWRQSEDLERLLGSKLSQINVESIQEIEAVFPCSTMQDGILLSQTKDTSHYNVVCHFEAIPSTENGQVDTARLELCWQELVRRHGMLRTVFVDSVSGHGAFDQVVLMRALGRVERLHCTTENFDTVLSSRSPLDLGNGHLPHRLTIISTESGFVHCIFEASHAIIDGTSVRVLFHDLQRAYDHELPAEKAFMYSDYVLHGLRQSKEQNLQYWAKYLKNTEPCLLPTPRLGSINKQKLQSCEVRLDDDRSLRSFCEIHEITLANLLQAAWGLVLRYFTGLDDVCFGYLTSGRDAPLEGIDEGVGAFVNLLICRMRVSDFSNSIDLGHQVQEDFIRSLTHQFCSLAEIQRTIELSGNRLFNTVMSLQRNLSQRQNDAHSVSFLRTQSSDPTEFDIAVSIFDSVKGLKVSLDYWENIMSAEAAVNVANTYSKILTEMTCKPHGAFDNFDILSEHAKCKIQTWNASVASPGAACIHWLFDRQVKERPNAQAICGWDGTYTYSELDRKSTQLSQYLVELGVTTETIVPLCFEKSSWASVALFAVLKAGAAFAPLDPSHPLERLQQIVQQLDSTVVLSSSNAPDIRSASQQTLITLSHTLFDELRPFESQPAPSSLGSPENAAYVIFTSGSTGQPKGVIIEHRAYCSGALVRAKHILRNESSRVAQISSASFDTSVEDIITTLLHGGCVYVPSDYDRSNAIVEFINRHQINVVDLTPSFVSLISPDQVPTLSTLILGGEPMKANHIADWASRVSLINTYGPTECSIVSTVTPRLSLCDDPANIGVGVGVSTWVVDRNNYDRLVPIGAVGELLIEGPSLARGYLNDELKTIAAFVKNPAWTKQQGSDRNRRFYRTGDLVRYNMDGSLVFCGRKDTQVKVRGQRVEISEIEHHIIMAHSGRGDVAVELLKPAAMTGDAVLVAFLAMPELVDARAVDSRQSDDRAACLAVNDAMRQRLVNLETTIREKMPSYMVPKLFVPLRNMPATISGKLDRAALRKLLDSLKQSDLAQYSLISLIRKEVTTPMENDLQWMWAQTLKLDASSIGAEDSFFRVGGDSIAAIRLANLVRSNGLSLTVADVFRFPKLSQMALLVGEKSTSNEELPSSPEPFSLIRGSGALQPILKEITLMCGLESERIIQDVYPCTPLQEGLMALSSKQPQSYVAQNIYALPEVVDVPSFRRAWEAVVQRNSILRTRIVYIEGIGSLQVVLQEPLEWQTAATVQAYLEKHEQRTYGKQLCEYAIIQEPSGANYMVWTLHHAVYDGWSLPLILKQVTEAYSATKLAEAPSPPFANFIKYLTEVESNPSDDFWRRYLCDASSSTFPARLQGDQVESLQESASLTVQLPEPSDLGITTSTILRAAWGIVLSQWTRMGDDVIFGATLNGRSAAVVKLDEIAGPTLTTVPVRIKIQSDQKISQFLQDVQRQATNMIPFEHTGLQHIKRLDETFLEICDFQNLLVIQPASDPSSGPAEDTLMRLEAVSTPGASFHTYPLVVECKLYSTTMEVSAKFDVNRITTEEVNGVLRQFRHVIQNLGQHAKVVDINEPTLDRIDRINSHDKDLLRQWNKSCPPGSNQCVHWLIESQVRRRGGEQAICGFDGDLTYSQLDQLATKLSCHLRSLGVRPETKVVICFEKSKWAIVSMLAILKAGGAYVPLNPSHPISRSQAIIDDVHAEVILISPSQIDRCRSFAIRQVIVSAEEMDKLPDIRPFPRLEQSCNAAYILYTSGSTGKPKGVVIEHASLSTSVWAQGLAVGYRETSRVLQYAAYTFDVSVGDIFGTLVHGGCVCVLSDDQRLNDLSTSVRTLNVDHACLTPSVARLLDITSISNLKTLSFGGEPVTREDLTLWDGNSKIVNAYGVTETTVFCSFLDRSRTDKTTKAANVGHSSVSSLWITDPDDPNKLVPIGAEGELLIEGPTLAREYLNDPVKTADCFLGQTLWATDFGPNHRRFYRTGDLARFQQDGSIEFLGRKDSQVKIRGQRLELGEVEHHLAAVASNPKVAVDLTGPLERPKERLLFAVVSGSEGSTSDSLLLDMNDTNRSRFMEIEDKLSERLPDYMVPSLFLPVENLPVTISGKLNRAKLRETAASVMAGPEYRQYSLATSDKKKLPETEAESRLRHFWSRILNLNESHIGVEDNFLRLGGDSIAAMRLTSMCQNNDLSLTVAEIFRHPKLREMARRMEKIDAVQNQQILPSEPYTLIPASISKPLVLKEASLRCRVEDTLIEDVYPCTPLQEGLMALSVNVQSQAYVAQNVYKLSPETDLDRFKSAWQRVVELNDILRTRIIYLEDQGLSLQVVIQATIQWQWAGSLKDYLAEDRQFTHGYGQPLTRWGIVDKRDTGGECNFILTAHHAVYDGWSLPLMLTQARSVYTRRNLAKPPSFSTFIRALANTDLEACGSFWRRYLNEAAPSALPAAKANTSGRQHEQQSLSLSISLNHDRNNQITISTIIRGAWALIVARYANVDDVTFGVTLTGRNSNVPRISITDVVGPTITTVPFRVCIDRSYTISQYLSQVQNIATEMIPYEHFGLRQIRQLDPNFHQACDFQNLLVVQPVPAEDELNRGFMDLQAMIAQGTSFHTYPLVVECRLGNGFADLVAKFDDRKLSKFQMDRMLHQFAYVIQQLISKSSVDALQTVSLFSPQDKQNVEQWNNSPPKQLSSCVHQLVEARSNQQPNAIAVCSWDGNLTYDELNDLATRLSYLLATKFGAGSEVMVPICFEKSKFAIVAMLGILKTGSACVPLNPSHPRSRTQLVLEDVQARYVLASPEQAQHFRELGLEVIVLSSDLFETIPKVEGPLACGRPQDAAFVVYTSGSTGKPKGIIQHHEAVCTSVWYQALALGYNDMSRILQFSAITFDLAIGDIFGSLFHGACICIPSEDQRLGDLTGAINHFQANQACLTPTVARTLRPDEITCLETLALGGEPLSKEDVVTWSQKTRLINIYGITETTVWCTCSLVTPHDHLKLNNVGRAFSARLWIVESGDHNLLAPIGAEGELLIEGPSLAREYLNDSHKTAASFIENPTWMKNFGLNGRLYKTGDLVQYSDDGTINFIGRKDSQVKIHGQRIELGEIEYHLTQGLSALAVSSQDAAVDLATLEGRQGEKVLVALICVPDLSAADHGVKAKNLLLEVSDNMRSLFSRLESYLADALPSHMVPSLFLPLHHMPTTVSGKLDRLRIRGIINEIPEPQLTEYSLASEQKRTPTTEMEKSLYNLWSRILGSSNIGADDSFFKVGGDSVTAMRLANLARAEKLYLTVADIFRNPKLCDMAATTRTISEVDPERSVPKQFSLIQKAPLVPAVIHQIAAACEVAAEMIEDAYPCTPLQEGLMALSVKETHAYVAQDVYRLGRIDVKRFQKAWEQVFALNPILRTRIVYLEGWGSLQVIIKENIQWNTDKSIDSYLDTDRKVEDCYGKPLSRYGLVQNKREKFFVWTTHHAMYDGWCLPILLNQVRDAYQGESLSTPPRFSAFIRYLQEIDQVKQNEFWKNYLDGATSSNFPARTSSNLKHSQQLLKQEVRFARTPDKAITISTILRAAWAIVNSRYSGSNDVVFGVTLSGRNAPVAGVDEMAAPTITTLPLRIRLDSLSTVADYLQAVQSEATDMIPFEHIGLQNIRNLLGNRHVCDFQNLLVIQPAHTRQAQEDLMTLQETFAQGENFFTYPLVMECRLNVNGSSAVDLVARFDDSRISKVQMETVLHQFEHAVQQIVLEPDRKIQDLNLVSSHDKAALTAWNNAIPMSMDTCIHWLFEKQAERRPNAQAICSWDGTLSYHDLSHLSDKVAQTLQQSFKTESKLMIPISFEKSKWAIVAMLGILKVGAAYVPINPSHPKKRIKAILEDLGAKTILTSCSYAEKFQAAAEEVIIVSEETLGCLTSLKESETSSSSSINGSSESPNSSPNSGSSSATSNQRRTGRPRDAAYVLYTSGTTGLPKGVIVDHRSLCTSVWAQGIAMGYTENSRVYQFADYTFDVSVGDIFGSLLHGSCICIPSAGERLNDLTESINSLCADQVCITPSLARMLQNPKTLRTLSLGGELVTHEDMAMWSGRLEVINSYGVTECTVFCAYAKLFSDQSSGPANIGQSPVARLWITEVDDHNKLAAVGSVGELLVEGPTVACGYLNNPTKTQEAFIESPVWMAELGLSSHYQFYKTGDLVKYATNGTIEYVERKDNQIKIHGQRVELGEIEHHLATALPGHIVAAALVKPADRQEHMLFGMVGVLEATKEAPKDIFHPVTDQLVSKFTKAEGMLADSLPLYMVPSFFIPMKQMPMGNTGKLDRRKLRDVIGTLTEAQLAHYSLAQTKKQEPQTSTERTLQLLWAKILSLDVSLIGRYDSFFRLGGDSIGAMRLAALARSEQHIILTVARIFKNPRLYEMALATESASSNDFQEVADVSPYSLLPDDESRRAILHEASLACGVKEPQIEDIYPCTPLQEAVMALSMKEGAYVAQNVYRFSDLNIDRFRHAWRNVVDLNEILRTRIVDLDEGSFQVVLKEDFQWRAVKSVKRYLNEDKRLLYGRSLSHYALVSLDSEDTAGHFIWTIHHALFDGWCLPKILRQVQDIYNNLSVSIRTPFRNFVHHLRNAKETSSAESFWHNYLKGADTANFPRAALARSSDQKSPQSTLSMNIPFARSSNGSEITASTIIRAAWGILLAKYSSAKDVVFGVTLTGRNASLRNIDNIIGPAITTVPLRVCFEEDTSIAETLSRLQSQSTEMIPFEHTGLQRIRRLDAAAQRACNFQSLLVIQPAPLEKTRIDSAFMELQNSVAQGVNFHTYPLVIECTLGENIVDVAIAFDTSLSKVQMQRMLHQFDHVVQQLLTESESQTIATLDLLTPQDISEIKAWNDEIHPEYIDMCIHWLVTEKSKEQPEAPAISSWDGEVNYSELEIFSDRLSNYLTNMVGIVPGARVPFCFQKCKWAVVSMLAILKAGAVCVPLNRTHPRARQELIISETQASVILVSASEVDMCRGLVKNTIVISEDLLRQIPDLEAKQGKIGKPHDGAFIMYTSGSTGLPKGVIQEHSAICTSVYAQGQTLGYTRTSRVLNFAAYSFDPQIGDIFGALLHGSCVCIPSEDQRLNNLTETMNEMQVDQACLTPSLARTLRVANLPLLRTLALGGEPLTEEDMTAWQNQARKNLVNIYGVTETTVWCACSKPGRSSRPNSIGQGFAARLWITSSDDHNELAAIGTEGELLIEGPTLARGYVGDSSRTDDVFIRKPRWASRMGLLDSQRLYKTGDIVRYAADGTIDFIGRKDGQVKLYGQRLELGEVEFALKQCLSPIVEVAAEVASFAASEDDILIGFLCIPNSSPRNSMLDVQSSTYEHLMSMITKMGSKLRLLLPSYMIPSAYALVSSMPSLTSGKRDRKTLRRIAQEAGRETLIFPASLNKDKRPPISEMEQKMQSLWARILKKDAITIGADDNFMDSGGDSISAMRLVALARAEGISLTVNDVFQTPSLSELCSACYKISAPNESKKPGHEPFSSLPLQELDTLISQTSFQRQDIEDIIEATDFQAYIVSCGLLRSRGWCNYFLFDFRGQLDVSRLQTACQQLVHHHSILRTVFLTHGRRIYQLVLNRYRIRINLAESVHEDLIPPMSTAAIEMDHNRAAKMNDAIVQFKLLKIRENTFRLVMRLSHAQYDGLCVPSFYRDMATFYAGRVPSPSPTFIDYTYTAQEQESREAEEFWKRHLEGSKMTNIVSHDQPSYQHPLLDCVSRVVPSATMTVKGVTAATALKAAWSIVLAQLSGSYDVTFGHLINTRNLPLLNVDHIVGPCINIIPVRVRLEGGTFQNLFQQVQEQQLTATTYGSFGFRKIIERCTQWPKWTRFSSVIQHQNLDEVVESLSFTKDLQCASGSFVPPNDAADVWILAMPRQLETEIKLHYNANVIPASLSEFMMNQLCQTLASLSANPTAEIPETAARPDVAFDHRIPISLKPTAQSAQSGATHDANERQVPSQDQTDTVSRAWAEVLCPTTGNPVADSVPFFEVWGQSIAAAALAEFYQQEGYDVASEDMISHPTMREQEHLLVQTSSGGLQGRQEPRVTSSMWYSADELIEHGLDKQAEEQLPGLSV